MRADIDAASGHCATPPPWTAVHLLHELKSEIDGFYADNSLTPRLPAPRNAVQTPC